MNIPGYIKLNFHHMRLASFCAIILLVFFAVPPLYAQDASSSDEETTEDVIDIGELYVEGDAIIVEEVIDRPTSFSAVIDPAEALRRSLTLPEVLDTVPGVTIRSFGGLGSLSTISIRGAGSENVLVILDGVPLNPSGGSVDLSDIPLSSLQSIEVIRGGESAYSGGGAAGGVIRLTSIQPDDSGAQTCSGRISLGSFNTLTSGFTWKPPDGILHLELESSRGDFPFLNDNGTSFESSDDFIDTRENNEFTAYEARYGHSWDLADNSDFTLSAQWHRGVKGIPGITTFPGLNVSQADSRYFIHALYRNPSFNGGQLDIAFSWLRQGRFYDDPLGESTGVPLQTSWIHTRCDTGLEWCGTGFSINDVLTIGSAYSLESLDSSGYEVPDRNTISLWARDEYYFPNDTVVTGALRMDSVCGDITFSPRIGARYPVNNELSLRSNFGLDYRPPSFEELYRNEGLVSGNADLTPERTLNFDLGLIYQAGHIRIEGVYFNLQTKNLIDYLLISGFRWKPFNIGRVRSSGFELSADWIIDPHWDFRANYTRTRAIDISGDPTHQGMPLVGQPSCDIYTELRWHENEWEAFLSHQYRGSSPVTPSGSRALSPDESFGIGIGHNFDSSSPHTSSFMFEIKNLFDENLSDIRGFPLPGRAFFLTWTGEW